MRRTRFVTTVSAFALFASLAAAPALVGLGCDEGDGEEAMEELEDEAEDAGDEIEDELDDHS